MIKEGFNIKKEFNKILKPIKEPIDFIQSFIEGLILVFEGIAIISGFIITFDGKVFFKNPRITNSSLVFESICINL